MKIKATCIVNNETFAAETEYSDDPAAIGEVANEAMKAANAAGHDDLSGYSVTITFIPPPVENVPDAE